MNQLPHSDGSPGSAGDGLQPGAAPGCLTCCTDTAGCCRPSAPQLLPDRLTEQVCSAAMSLRTGWIRSGLKHVTIHHVSGLSFIKRINQPVCGSTLSLPLSLPFFFFFFTIHKLRTGSGGNPQIYARRSTDAGRSSLSYTKWDSAVYMLSQQNKHSDIMENFPFFL